LSPRPVPNALARRIARGAIAHYEDAIYYDLAYRRRRADVALYCELAREHPGPVLELGVGTGRVALALAKAGVELVGIEPVAAMLAHAKHKARALPRAAQARLTLRRGDARRLRLGRRFSLVIAPFNVFMHLYTRRDLEQALAVARAHLGRRGRLEFDVSMPDLRLMPRPHGRLYRGRDVVHPTTGARYHYFEAFEYDPVQQVQMVSMVFQNLSDLSDMKSLPLSQRQFFPEELKALLHYNGFQLEHMWGDFERGALSDTSETQVVVARAR
jgi:SAM-dependent methyltransferase